MKIVGISCSPRKGKITKYALENCLSAIEQACPQVDTEFIDLAEMEINGCKACGHCMTNWNAARKINLEHSSPPFLIRHWEA